MRPSPSPAVRSQRLAAPPDEAADGIVRIHHLDAERTLLGALLIDPDRIIEVSPFLAADDFADPTFRSIYAAIIRLHEARTPIDTVTVSSQLQSDNLLDRFGGIAFLVELAAGVPTASHAATYAEIIRDKALHRRLLAAGRDIVAIAADQSLSGTEAVERSEQTLLALSRERASGSPQHIADVGAEAYDRYAALQQADDKAAFFGLTTGFNQLDLLLTGLPPGSLSIVAARPSIGKSSFALDIARHAAGTLGKTVAFFSLEMTKREIMDRVIAGFLGVETWRLKKCCLKEADFHHMGRLFDQLKEHPIYIDDDADTTLGNIRRKARRQQIEHGLDLLIIDYLQLIEVTDRAAGENRTQQVSHISRSLKNLARELNAPVIALSQLSRAVEQRSPPIPILSDLRESGGIEQDSDVVLMLYRESVYNEECENPKAADVYVRKNRHGPVGRIELVFDAERMSFRNP